MANIRKIIPSRRAFLARKGILEESSQHEEKKDQGIDVIESALPSQKTSILENLAFCCQQVFNVLPRLRSLYGSTFTNNRFLSYISGPKMASKAVNQFATGGKKYSRRNKDANKFGSGEKSSMATTVIKALKRVEKEGLLQVCKINENFTSKVCCLCHQQSNGCKKVIDNFSGRQVSLWGVLQCKICHYNWDIDKDTCHNIAYLADLE
ncbi:hypothetical protein K501DRAFT_266427 [Backusella circina FSU 941]|nr:hypothetical protein K501DRAFT_266427 [Backusella circina FSU 941]